MRFIMQCESKEDAERAVTLLKSYRPWYRVLRLDCDKLSPICDVVTHDDSLPHDTGCPSWK
jgi:hypothetical protein